MRFLCLSIFLLLTAVSADAAPSMVLVSIQLPDLGPKGYVSGFLIETWRIRIRAVCQIPVGWMITAGRNLDQSGQISGAASGFMTNLDDQQFPELQNLVLIDAPPTTAEKATMEPPTLQGTITVGTYAAPQAAERMLPLSAMNLVLRPAQACPAPVAEN